MKHENKDNDDEIKENKIDKDENKTIKPAKNENKTNKKNIKVKTETLKPDLKIKMKNKSKQKPAKPSEVNNKKITEFLLPSQDRVKTSTFQKSEILVAKPAKQEAKKQITRNTLSEHREGGEGERKQVSDISGSNGRNHSTYQGACKAELDWTDETR